MTGRHLVTTSLEETWPASGPVLFLGEWCRSYARREVWEPLDAEVVPFHWGDGERRLEDFGSIEGRYRDRLREFAELLNDAHGVDHDDRYWRILIGPWLFRAISVLWDRWTSIMTAAATEVIDTRVLPLDPATAVPVDLGDFGRLTTVPIGNHHLYSQILRRFTDVELHEVDAPVTGVLPPSGPTVPGGLPPVERALDVIGRFGAKLVRPGDALVFASFLRWRDVLATTGLMGQFPTLWRQTPPVERLPPDFEHRERVLRLRRGDAFDDCLAQMLPELLPTCYLEGFAALSESVASLPWPERPKVIWTANPHSDDVFRAYAAAKVEAGSPLVVSAHSGQHGQFEWFWMEDHEREVSDHYLTWGRGDPADGKTDHIGYFRARRPLGVDHAAQPHALMVLWACRQPSLEVRPEILGEQWLDYHRDHLDFVGLLPEFLRQRLIVRVHANDRGWCQIDRWRDGAPDVEIDDGTTTMEECVARSRLYLATYLASNNLEALIMGVPTVFFWRPDVWRTRPEVTRAYERLAEVGVFQTTPEGAAAHVSAVWDDVDGWWRSPAVEEAVEEFMDRYCRPLPRLPSRVAGILRDVARRTGPRGG